MLIKSLEMLKHETPNRYVFTFAVGAPDKDGVASLYQGTLPVDSYSDLSAFINEFQRLLVNFTLAGPPKKYGPSKEKSKPRPKPQPLPKLKAPKGMVVVRKKKPVAGEDNE